MKKKFCITTHDCFQEYPQALRKTCDSEPRVLAIRAGGWSAHMNTYLDMSDTIRKKVADTDQRLFVRESEHALWVEVEYDEHFLRRRLETEPENYDTFSTENIVFDDIPAPEKSVPWWDQHYSLPTAGHEHTAFSIAYAKPEHVTHPGQKLWHQTNAEINAQRREDLLELRRFVRDTICSF